MRPISPVVTLFINGEQVGAGKIKKQVRGRDGVGGLVSSI